VIPCVQTPKDDQNDPDLNIIVTAWSKLSPEARAGILAIVYGQIGVSDEITQQLSND
jgi:UDP-N-acetyl-D-mannosaminuronate dehydrogenase